MPDPHDPYRSRRDPIEHIMLFDAQDPNSGCNIVARLTQLRKAAESLNPHQQQIAIRIPLFFTPSVARVQKNVREIVLCQLGKGDGPKGRHQDWVLYLLRTF